MSSPAAAAGISPVQAAEQAYRSLVSGKLVEAVKLYSEAIESRKLAPEMLANALLNRALAYQNMNQHAEAVDDYSAAMHIDALSARLRAVALYNRGISNQKLKKPAQAIEDYTNALFLDVEFSQAYYSRGNVLRENGQYLFALSDYEKALKYEHPEPYLPLYGTALTYEDLKRPDQAQKSLVQALALKPDFAAARIKLASMLNEDQGRAVASPKPAPSSGGNANLALGADQIVTGSVSGKSPDMVMRKKDLPVPVSPPSALMAKTNMDGEPASKVKKVAALQEIDAPEDVRIEPTKATPSAAAAEPEKTLQGWTVQVSSQLNEGAAWDVWNKLKSRHSGLLNDQTPMVVRADLGKKGVFYRLRVHKIDSRKAAARLCSNLKRRGTSCFVSQARS